MFAMKVMLAVAVFAIAFLFSPYPAVAPIHDIEERPEQGPPRIKEPMPAARILFAGDMMFDRSIRQAVDEKGGPPGQAGDFIFSCIDEVLRGADLVVANLEGPITEHPSVSAGSEPGGKNNYTFTFPASTAALLARHNIRLVNLGNNHILNFGYSGARSTLSALEKEGVGYFGDPISQSAATSSIGGIEFAFINYNEFALSPRPNKLEYESLLAGTLQKIRSAKASGQIPVVYAHWGVEYATTSSAYSRELAHSFIDAGAEVIIGSHPHVVQEREIYGSTTLTTGRGKHIYYSLGNFIFDQYFSDDVRRGLLLEVAFDKEGAQNFKEIPVELLRDRKTALYSEPCG